MAVARTKQRSRTSRQVSRTAAGRNRDRALIAAEPYSLKYLHKRFPDAAERDISRALEQCKDEVKTDDHQQIMNCLKRKLAQ
jgi:hypothetical protein